MFDSDTAEDDFDGFSAQEGDRRRSMNFPGRLLSSFFYQQKKSICSMYLFMLPYAFN